MARLSILETGIWDVPRNEIIEAESPEIYAENRRHKIPGFSVLVQDEKIGNLLWDTGITDEWKKIWPDKFKEDYTFDKLCRLEDELSKVNISPEDIDCLVLSHLHYDHSGNVKLFKNTRAGQNIIISKGEALEAFPNVCMDANGVSGAYLREEFVMNGIGYQTIEEDTWLSDGIFLFIQVGHTPGVIGLMVKTEKNGNMIFTSDAVYSALNFGPPVVLPGLCTDPAAYKENILRLQKMQKEYKAKIYFGHDLEGFKELKLVPYWYE